MLRTLLIAAAAASLAFIANAGDPEQKPERDATKLVDWIDLGSYGGPIGTDPLGSGLVGLKQTINRQPVLLYELSGITLLGPVTQTVVAYSSGDITMSQMIGHSNPPSVIRAQMSVVSLESFLVAMYGAGVAGLQDQEFSVTDAPLRTVTVLSPGTDAIAHSFSYYIPDGDYAGVSELLRRFVEELAPLEID